MIRGIQSTLVLDTLTKLTYGYSCCLPPGQRLRLNYVNNLTAL